MRLNTVAATQTSDIAPVLSKEFLDIQATTACSFTLKARTWHDNIIQEIGMMYLLKISLPFQKQNK